MMTSRFFSLCKVIIPGLAVWTACGFQASAVSPQVMETPDALTIVVGENPVLTYHKSEVPPPAGVDPLFTRSGFIHPVRTPAGKVVTSIHAPDHYHHFGLWHAWVKAFHRGREVDFWNLKKGQATIRYVETVERSADAGAAGFVVRQSHVALADSEHAEEIVLDEQLRVVVRPRIDGYVIDYEFTQRNVTDAPLELPAYRYGGGVAYRGPLDWGKDNSDYLSANGKTRSNGHETRSRWIAMHGQVDDQDRSFVILAHPANHDAPQRMRVWPSGPIFFNYVPTQEFDWSIAPGEQHTLRYRLWVQDGRPDAALIEQLWREYEAIPVTSTTD